jgi:chondroitin AC lyase
MTPPVLLLAAAAAAAAATLAAAAPAAAGGDPDIAAVRQRLLDELCYPPLASTNLTAYAAQAARWAAALRPNGTWADVNYTDSGDRADWLADAHVVRTAALASAAVWPASPLAGDGALYNASRAALRAWSALDPQNVNWWWDIISLPQAYGCIYLVLGAAPDAQRAGFPDAWELARGYEVSFRAAWWNASLGYEVTGANRAWMIQAQLARGAWGFAENATALDQGFGALWAQGVVLNRTTDFSGAQGIQPDWSFQSHGPQLQVGSYGQAFSGDMLGALVWHAGVPRWAPPPAAAATLCAFWGRGQGPLTVGLGFDWTAVGRQVSRVGIGSEYGFGLNTTRIRAAAGGVCGAANASDAAAMAAWADRADDAPGAAPLVGTYAYWASDAVVHRRPGWVAVVHGHSNRTTWPECGNGENLKGRYMGEGTLAVYATACGPRAARTGCSYEYDGIFPLWDWSLVPGVLAPADRPVPDCTGACCWRAQVESAPFVGSSTDGGAGVFAMPTAMNGGSITGRRSWHLLPDAVVALAAGVSGGGHHLRTALAQQWLRQTGVTVGWANGSVAALPDGNYTLGAGAAGWLHADTNGWVPLAAAGPPQAVGVSAGRRWGNYDTIGPSDQPVTGRTLAAWLDHGVLGDGGGSASWGYAQLPNVSAGDMPARVGALAAGGLVVVANDAAVQAVAARAAGSDGDDAGVAAGAAATTVVVITSVFWPPPGCDDGGPSGRCAGGGWVWPGAPGGPLVVNVSAPALLTLTLGGGGGGTLVLAASNPDTPGGLALRVTVNRALAGAGCGGAGGGGSPSVVDFALPADPATDMGASVVRTCTVVGPSHGGGGESLHG